VVVLCLERPRDSAQTVGNQSAAGSQQVSCGLMQMMPTRLSIAGEPR